MKISAAKILFAVILAAVIAVASAAPDVRMPTGSQSLSINGVNCTELVSWSGGDASGKVVVESASVGATAKKHLGGMIYAPIIAVVSLPLSPALQNGLADLCANRTTTQTLLLIDSDGTRLQATNAQLIEARFPVLDGTARDAWNLTLVFRPESTQLLSGGSAGSVRGGSRSAVSSNFRFTLAGLPGNQVSRIEAFTITRAAPAGAGIERDYAPAPGLTQIPDLSVTISQAGAPDWTAWRNDFLIQGNSSDAQEKNGSLEILASDLRTVLLPLQFSHVGITRLAHLARIGSVPDTYRAELYCEGMSVASVPVSGASTPAAATETAPPTPAPAPATAEPAPGDPNAPADPKTPTKVPEKIPESAPAVVSPASVATRANSAEAATSPKDKGSRDPADFPRAEGTIRTQYSAVRGKGTVQETANYTAKAKSDDLMAFYEKRLKGDGWEETARYENDNGTDHAHQITTTWKKDIRSVSMTFMDNASGGADVQVVLESREK